MDRVHTGDVCISACLAMDVVAVSYLLGSDLFRRFARRRGAWVWKCFQAETKLQTISAQRDGKSARCGCPRPAWPHLSTAAAGREGGGAFQKGARDRWQRDRREFSVGEECAGRWRSPKSAR